MKHNAMAAPSDARPNNNSLLIALFVAVLVHIVLVLGMTFSTNQPEVVNKPIDITLVNTPVKKAPEKIDFLAPDNQSGAGKQIKKPEPQPQILPAKEQNNVKQIKKIAREETKPKAAQKIITQAKSENKIATTHKTAVVSQPEKHPQLTAESLQQQIAQLGAAIRQSRPSADQAKIKFVDSVSAHKYVAAQYMKDWETKVERMGNLNYPEEAAKKNFSGSLTMDVGINADGNIYSIRISRSSGNIALDEAAKKIVRMSAPFAPLPLELRKELDVLVITRVWKFSDESGLVTR
ncbi:MAG: TonB family protein [Methylococcales bacterium]|nr:TonB family protein [Methylococcales bacterium]